jgi:bifunctional ADP-heptose synthase (sugar kinase/adenylyltransferase)
MMASGADLHAAMRIANLAAGIVVGKLGTAVVQPDELAASLSDANPRPAPARRGA